MEPNIHLNFTAVLIATIATFVFGYVWYTLLFGKMWAAEMKMDMTQKPPASVMIRGMIMMVIGNFLMAFVFAHNIAAWNPLTWGQAASTTPPLTNACMAAFFTFLGFYLPQDMSKMAWENKSWKLFFINAAYHLLSLFVAALILVMM
jgi:hypothetical protein